MRFPDRFESTFEESTVPVELFVAVVVVKVAATRWFHHDAEKPVTAIGDGIWERMNFMQRDFYAAGKLSTLRANHLHLGIGHPVILPNMPIRCLSPPPHRLPGGC